MSAYLDLTLYTRALSLYVLLVFCPMVGTKQVGREADQSPSSRAKVKNECSIFAMDTPSWCGT